MQSGARTSHVWMEPPGQMSGPELASVHGGATVTGSAPIALAERGSRWTLGVLGVAALLGVSAAIAIQMAPGKLTHTAEAAPQLAVAPQPAAAPQAAPAAVVAPVVASAPAPLEAKPTIDTKPTQPVETAPVERAPVEPSPVEAKAAPIETHEPRPALAFRPHAAKPAPAPKKIDATLRVKSDAYATITIGNDQQDTPGAKFHLTAGSHTVRIRNSDMGVAFSCQVSVEPNRVKTLSIYMTEKQCFDE
jgi:hypothetical protein